MTANVDLIALKIHGDERGSLVALGNGHHLPFDVKRVYYIFGTKEGVSRGFHAHKKLTQLLVALSGSCRIICEYNNKKEEYILSRPDEGLQIDGLVWREKHDFLSDCVLPVLAFDYYNEADYVRDYTFFNRKTDDDFFYTPSFRRSN